MVILQWPAFPMTLAIVEADLPPRALLVRWCLFATAMIVTLGLLRSVSRLAAALAAVAVSIYCTVCAALAFYRLYTHEWVDLMIVIAIPRDSIATLRTVAGDGGAAAIVVLLLVHVVIYFFSAIAIGRVAAAEPAARSQTLFATIVLVPIAAFAGAPHSGLLVDWTISRRTETIRPIMDRTPYTIAPAEPVFLVQLESLNAIAVNGEYETGGKRVRVDGIPVMRRLAEEGILFTHMWNVDVQTHRVQQAFLCGAIRNMSARVFYRQVMYSGGCVPDLFRKAGYKTVFLKGVDDPAFAGANKIMPAVGYQDVRFDEFMEPGDENHLWGYEEGIYFQRSMEYLERTYKPGDRLFVHFAVSAHHASFARTSKSLEWFHAPHAKQVEGYIASARKQDAAVAPLVERIRRFTGGKAHIFVFGDHSYPVGLYGAIMPWDGATVDNFVTVMLYLPPQTRAAEFALGRTIDTLHGQTDLAATLAELTSGKPHPNSLVPFMLREPPAQFDYERCHVMTQPYGTRKVLIAHGEKAYVYSFDKRCIETLRLTYDPLRQHSVATECDVEFAEFERRYMCARYRR